MYCAMLSSHVIFSCGYLTTSNSNNIEYLRAPNSAAPGQASTSTALAASALARSFLGEFMRVILRNSVNRLVHIRGLPVANLLHILHHGFERRVDEHESTGSSGQVTSALQGLAFLDAGVNRNTALQVLDTAIVVDRVQQDALPVQVVEHALDGEFLDGVAIIRSMQLLDEAAVSNQDVGDL